MPFTRVAALPCSLALLAVPLPAWQGPCGEGADVETLGLATPGAAGPLELALEGAPVDGLPFRFRVRGLPPTGHGCLAFSLHESPVFLPPFGATIYPSAPLMTVFVADAQGESPPLLAQAAVGPALCGVTFVAQAAATDAAAAGGASFTKAVRTRFGAGAAGPLLLSVPGAYPVGGNLLDAAAADLNGDQNLDVAFLALDTAGLDEAVWVLFGGGDGTFGRSLELGTGGTFPSRFAVGDVTADGNPDIATTANGIRLLLGERGGAFAPPFFVFEAKKLDDDPSGIAIADVDDDGIGDILFTRQFVLPGDVGVLLSLGDGTFLEGQTLPVGRDPIDLALGDWNLDGALDFATANRELDAFGTQGSVSTALGNGDGTFGPAQTMGTGTPSSSLAVWVRTADFGADGVPDLAALTKFGGDSVCVFTGLGGGGFSAPAVLAAGTLTNDFRVADVDRDLFPDILVAASVVGTDGIRIFFNEGDGTFAPFVTPDVGGDAWSIAAGDFDGDLLPDFAVTDELVDEARLVRHGLLP